MKGRLVLVALTALLVTSPILASAGPAHRPWSTTPPGPYGALAPTLHEMAASDGTHISYAVFMPNVPAGTKVPVILSAGPYFDLLEEPVNVPSSERMTGFLIANYVSHGYAVVAASVRGTGWSGGCMELMSEREARDLDELVTRLGTAPWSTGSVGMIGKSYDGATPWMVAQFGNPYLKTIVPVAGVTNAGDLLVHRGSAQFRTPIFHSIVYWPFGFGLEGLGVSTSSSRSLEDRAANAVCPEAYVGTLAGPYSTYTGDTEVAPVIRDYWTQRNFVPGTLANYQGSVFIVHGLKDFNVNPSQVIPLFNELPQTKKMMLGQWTHQYADEGGATNRNDFATILRAWFDKHLKGAPVGTGPIVEVADARTFTWRSANEWPATNPTYRTYGLGAASVDTNGGSAFTSVIATPAGTYSAITPCQYRASASFATPTAAISPAFRIAGQPLLDLTFSPATYGTVHAALCHGSAVVAHGSAAMLYGQRSNTPTPYVPGLAHTMTIEFEPAEYSVPANAQLRLAVTMENYGGQRFANGRQGDDLWPGTSPGVAVLTGGNLRLPLG